jgi:hypothetical protein
MSEKDGAARAKQYREQAAACLEWANKMSLQSDRARMMDMAARWLDLAKEAETKEA